MGLLLVVWADDYYAFRCQGRLNLCQIQKKYRKPPTKPKANSHLSLLQIAVNTLQEIIIYRGYMKKVARNMSSESAAEEKQNWSGKKCHQWESLNIWD